MKHPLFSIGVTTYRRPMLLRECLDSIRAQDMSDFDVWIGNDDPDGPLRAEDVGANDPRFHLLNRDVNLGETANMNDLLERAQGVRFTWLADDDMLLSGALARFQRAIETAGNPPVVYAPLLSGVTLPAYAVESYKVHVFTGDEWLDFYLSREHKIAGCYAAYDPHILRKWGGMQRLGNGRFSPYADNLLAVQAGVLSRVGYVSAPAFFLRTHAESASVASCDLDLYANAQKAFLERCRSIIIQDGGHVGLQRVRFVSLIAWCVRDVRVVARRGAKAFRIKLIRHAIYLLGYAKIAGWKLFMTVALLFSFALKINKRKH